MSFRNPFSAKIYGFLFRKMGFSYTNVYKRTSIAVFFARIVRKIEYLRFTGVILGMWMSFHINDMTTTVLQMAQ